MAEDPTRGLENNAAHARFVYLSTIRPMPMSLLLKEYELFVSALIDQAPKGFIQEFAKVVAEKARKTLEA